MKKILLWLILGLPAFAQTSGNVTMLLFPGTVSGSCSLRQFAMNQSSGQVYSCHLGAWQTIQGGVGGAVTSVFNRTGAITAANGDYTVAQVTGAAPLTSPTFLISAHAPTPLTTDNSTQIATTAWVKAQGYGSGGTNPLSGCTTPTPGNLLCDNSIQGGTGTVGMLTLPYSSSGLPAPPSTAEAAIAANASGQLYWSPGNTTAFAPIGTGGGGGSVTGVTTFNNRNGDIIPQASDYAAFFAPIGGGTAVVLGGVTIIQ